jgi:hypothetical protein
MQCYRGSIPSSQPLAACQAPQWPATFAQMLIIATQKIESGNMTVIGTPTRNPQQSCPSMERSEECWIVELFLKSS